MPARILHSILDSDLYKYTMQQAVLEQFPETLVTYKFINRDRTMKFSDQAWSLIVDQIRELRHLFLQPDEYEYIRSLGIFKPAYAEYLRNYRYDPNEVSCLLVKEAGESFGNLEITIRGPWHRTILWEVPLMAIISEVYFCEMDRDWDCNGQEALADAKAQKLCAAGLKWADFGTRRRRNLSTQECVVHQMRNYNGFVGTSNVHLAQTYHVKPIGTMAHEWIMGVSALRGLRHANHNAMYCWLKTYQANLGIALTDTFGTEAFFEDFDLRLAKTFDGVRHDSGDPQQFVDKVVAHYKKLKIDPSTKTIVFSDGLNVETAQLLANYCSQIGIRCSFGIGTHFTNDFKKRDGSAKSKALNMVIKLTDCDGIPVVKLSDTPSKAIGDKDALRVARWTFFGTPLDKRE